MTHGPPVHSNVGAMRHKEENYTGINGGATTVGGLGFYNFFGTIPSAANSISTSVLAGAAAT